MYIASYRHPSPGCLESRVFSPSQRRFHVLKACPSPHRIAVDRHHLDTLITTSYLHRHISPQQAASIACTSPPIAIHRQAVSSHASSRLPSEDFTYSRHARVRIVSPWIDTISTPSSAHHTSIATYRLCKQLASPVHRASSPSGVRASRITRLSHANAILRVFRARSTPHRIASVHRYLLPPSTLWRASIALVASDCLSPSPAPCKAPHRHMVPRLLGSRILSHLSSWCTRSFGSSFGLDATAG
jgi:hypothetical protein